MTARATASLAILMLLTAFAGFSGADPRPVAHALRIADPITLDGVMAEPAWQRAEPITDFQLIYVREGETPSEKTSVKVLVDDDNIYFGVRCGREGTAAIRSSLAPRDQILDDDQVAIHLDTYRDRRRAYVFGVNAHGVQLDGILDGEEPDFTWDGVWSAETSRDDHGWSAEIAIPLRALRFPSGADVWGLWIRRQITDADEVCTWPLWKQSIQGDIMLQAGDLDGLDGLSGGGGLEVQPYVASSRVEERRLDQSWFERNDANVGLDLEYGLTTTLTANATINPDYSQVEADALQIDVNQRFPLFYPEKRPFFLEGAEIFSTPLDLVYTRRIADPSYGGKVVGKSGRVSIGAIAAYDEGGGSLGGIGRPLAFTSAPGAPEGMIGIGRVALDLGDRSRIGVLVTGRRFDERASAVAHTLGPQSGRSGLIAADSRLGLSRTLSFDGQLAWSDTRVESNTDVGGPVTSRASLSDAGYSATLRYGDGIRNLSLYQSYLGPDFVAATGFLERVDVRQSGWTANFYARPENAWLRSWQPILNGYVIHDHTGGLQEWWVSPMIDWAFEKQTTMHTMYVRSMERWMSRDYELDTYIFNLGNSLWRSLSANFYARVGDGVFYGPSDAESFRGWSEYYELSATLRPSPQLTSEAEVARSRFSRRRGGDQVFDVWVLGANTTYQFTRELYARFYPQYDTGREHLDLDLLIGYVLSPGRVLYAGVSGAYDEIDGRRRNSERGWFVKASYVFQR